jgi:hypothetical protein
MREKFKDSLFVLSPFVMKNLNESFSDSNQQSELISNLKNSQNILLGSLDDEEMPGMN